MTISKLIKISTSVTIGVIFILFLFLLTRHAKVREAYSEFPDTKIEDFNGEQIAINQKVDIKKPTVILFFDPSCSLCVVKITKLLERKSQIEDVTLLFVTWAEKQNVVEFLKDYPINTLQNAQILFDVNFDLSTIYNIQSPPASIFYNDQGKLITVKKGAIDINVFMSIINKL
jgi:thioredoxin-related protein